MEPSDGVGAAEGRFRGSGPSSLDRSTSEGTVPFPSKVTKTWLKKRAMGRRGGVLLDLVLVITLVLLGAYALDLLGITFSDILNGAAHFFGI